MSDVQDLNTLGATTTGRTASVPATAGQIIEKPYDPTPDRENIRGTIALWLVWTLVGVVAAVVVTGLITIYGCHVANSCTPETNELKAIRVVIELVLTPLVGLVGAVTGFYFGEKTASARSGG
ncbi:hypothetical protein [Bradyrhizobium sp. AZCC 1721]|uniref:hypothetical protein n=1 Tax=Bradyrhizobium sp. AZCC 1721 TaxID=3117016 RepID=UPI002FF1F98C